jgi:predicted XRE-type DNA-binding protein
MLQFYQNICKNANMKESTCIDTPKSISDELTAKFKQAGIKQPLIAEKTEVNQSQVSLILSGKFKRRSKNVDKICKYAKLKIVEHKVDPIHNQALMDALSNAWDGTDSHAKIIAKILNALGGLKI